MSWLTEQYRLTQEREDRRAAVAAWAILEAYRNRDARYEPFTLEEVVAWLGHGFQRLQPQQSQQEDEPATTEELMERAHLMMELYGQSKQQNGSRADE